MTARQVFEATLIELSKVQAPALKLYEFNYLFNKAINQYINKVYNTYDINQQTTDDLRVLKSTAYLTPKKFQHNSGNPYSALHNKSVNASSYLSTAHSSIQSLHGATYEVGLPIDYLHLLNCVCIYYVAKTKDCYDAGSFIEIPAIRLTADSWSLIVTDIYNRPSPMRPYYYIHNQNNQTNNGVLPTDPIARMDPETGMPDGTDLGGNYHVTTNMKSGASSTTITTYKNATGGMYYTNGDGNMYTSEACNTKVEDTFDPSGYTIYKTETIYTTSDKDIYGVDTFTPNVEYPDPESTLAAGGKEGSNFPRTFKLDFGNGQESAPISLVEKPIGLRTGNTSNVRMEIRYGKDDSLFLLKEVQVDYVKAPLFIRLTQEQIDLTEDTSQIMEFPDYVNQEIINELVHLVMEHANDPRLSNNILMTTTIARPTGQLQQAQAQG